MFKGFMLLLTRLLFDEEVQVHGFVYLNDLTGYTINHFTSFGKSDMIDLMKWQVSECVVRSVSVW